MTDCNNQPLAVGDRCVVVKIGRIVWVRDISTRDGQDWVRIDDGGEDPKNNAWSWSAWLDPKHLVRILR